MPSIVQILVAIAAVLAIASGIWVAIALVRALTRTRPNPDHNRQNEARP